MGCAKCKPCLPSTLPSTASLSALQGTSLPSMQEVLCKWLGLGVDVFRMTKWHEQIDFVPLPTLLCPFYVDETKGNHGSIFKVGHTKAITSVFFAAKREMSCAVATARHWFQTLTMATKILGPQMQSCRAQKLNAIAEYVRINQPIYVVRSCTWNLHVMHTKLQCHVHETS